MSDDRSVDGLEHLQSAALELIAAARAFLDVAEEVVREPAVAVTIVQAAAGVGRTILGATDRGDAGDGSPPRGAKVRRIDVS